MLYINKIFLSLIFSASGAFSNSSNVTPPPYTTPQNIRAETPKILQTNPQIPFYSQFDDIESPKWKKVGCGIASLAMIIEHYKPGIVSVNELLEQGISNGAYLEDAGWKHKDLVILSEKYDLVGEAYDLSKEENEIAFSKLESSLKKGPVIASVRYKMDPQSPIPHLAVINNIQNNIIRYNDPAMEHGNMSISIQDFMNAWNKRYIVIRPK